VLIDLDACVFCGMCANLCPARAFRMTVVEKPASTEAQKAET
jgi:formate hydrogenlyase subunit 6/NADH:ubiquinone oxidoreductase subunit I